MVDCIKQQEIRVHPQEEYAVINDFFVPGEQGRCAGSSDHENGRDDQSYADRNLKRADGSFIGTVFFSGSDILADEGSRGLRQRVDRQKNERIQFVVGTPAGHARGSKAIDIGLDENV